MKKTEQEIDARTTKTLGVTLIMLLVMKAILDGLRPPWKE